jgi:Spy/CpxP family protein refolding chaperone
MKISKVVRKTTLIAALFLSFAGAVSAQKDSTAHSPETRARKMTDKMKTELTLTDDQYKQVYDINLKYGQKNQDALKGDGSKLEKAKALKTENQGKNKELKAVLTPEQFEKYKEMQKEKREELKQMRKEKKADGSGS